MESVFMLEWFPIWFAQIMRGICLVVAPFCILLSGYHFHVKALSLSQRCRYASLSLLLISCVYTQAERWGEVATPRLFIATTGIMLAFAGLWTLRKDDV